MSLDDGRFLVSASRFDQLALTRTPEELAAEGLLRTHPDFRVIALGLPVPAYPGFPLDPPLRSRFQARFVEGVGCLDAAALPPGPARVWGLASAVNAGLVRLSRQTDAITQGSGQKAGAGAPSLHLLPVRVCVFTTALF